MVEGSDAHEAHRLRPSQAFDTLPEIKVPPADNHKWRILLEPALVGAMVAINLGQTSLQNFYLRTACTVDLGKNMSVCETGVGEEFRAAEAASQVVVSSVNISRSFIGSLIATIVLMFVGPWSDCSGRRKPLLIMPLVGMTVTTSAVLLMLMFPGATTAQVLYIVQIPMSMGGNFGLLLTAAFSYIGDVCHSTGRDVTRTMGTHRAAIQVAHVVGALCGPQLYRHLGFYGVFPIVLLLQVTALIYVIWTVKDVNVNEDNTVSVINWRLPINAVKCLMRSREGFKRSIIVLMLAVALGDRVFLSAEVLIAYMYFRYKFHWDDIIFGSFLAYRNIVSFLGTLFILMVLKRRFRLSDEVVGALSCSSYVLAYSGLIAAPSTFFVFLIPIIGFIAQGSQVVQRPLLNKQILPTEQGKIYSVMGALESATQAISNPLYSLLYSRTVSTMPDAWILPGIVLAVMQLFAYLVARRLGLRNIQPVESPVKKNIPLKPIYKGESEKPLTEDHDDIINSKEEKNSKIS